MLEQNWSCHCTLICNILDDSDDDDDDPQEIDDEAPVRVHQRRYIRPRKDKAVHSLETAMQDKNYSLIPPCTKDDRYLSTYLSNLYRKEYIP